MIHLPHPPPITVWIMEHLHSPKLVPRAFPLSSGWEKPWERGYHSLGTPVMLTIRHLHIWFSDLLVLKTAVPLVSSCWRCLSFLRPLSFCCFSSQTLHWTIKQYSVSLSVLSILQYFIYDQRRVTVKRILWCHPQGRPSGKWEVAA